MSGLDVLLRYLWRVRRRRGKPGGAFALVWGVGLLAVTAVVAAQGKGISWPAAGTGVLLVAAGLASHHRAGRRPG